MNLDKMQQGKQKKDNKQPHCCLLKFNFSLCMLISLLCHYHCWEMGTFFLIISSFDTKN